ncbi:MAG TPA: hypothetical protein VGL42_18285 [Opitutaceae bacterium]|jgi:hypothetical protein
MSRLAQLNSYLRLARHRTGSIWLGDDHLFIVARSGFTEKYLRIALKDAQGIFVTSTERRTLWALPAATVACFSAIALGVTWFRGDRPYISLPLLLVALIGLAVNLMMGAGTRAYLLTRVQMLSLPAMRRKGPAERVANLIEEACRRQPVPASGP